MLELLSGFESVRVSHLGTVDLVNVGESVDDECPDEGCARDLVILDGNAGESG